MHHNALGRRAPAGPAGGAYTAPSCKGVGCAQGENWKEDKKEKKEGRRKGKKDRSEEKERARK